VIQNEQPFHHNVYVVLLDDAVTKHPSILRLNPKRDPLKPCIYVGMTGIPVVHRFENHRNGYKSSALWQLDDTCDGFDWIDFHDADNSEHSILIHLPPLATVALTLEK
jgi:hypothetical protein